MNQGIFITGTDTNVGKTLATLSLMRFFQNRGLTVIGMKPVASGCNYQQDQWQNADALALQQAASLPVAYELINPYAYALPVSPDIAGVSNPVDLALVCERYQQLQAIADIVLVEGAGGWYTPINQTQDISDLASALDLPIILVVAMRLGCINQAKLSYLAIKQSGLTCLGWLATCVEPDLLCLNENIAVIKTSLDTELLGVLPYQAPADFNWLAHYFDAEPLLNAVGVGSKS